MQYSRQNKDVFLERLVADRKITMDGKEWLTAALDPFHDYNHQIAGYPDADVSQTTVSCYQYEIPVKNPGVAAADTWDCHVFSTPQMFPTTNPAYTQTADWSRITEPVSPVSYPTGPLSIVCAPSGTALGWPLVTPANFSASCLPATGTEDLASGVSRVIAMGFEVHNTTAEIYKQGSVTTYRMPQAKSQNTSLFSNNGSTSYGVVSGYRFSSPPSTVAQANLLKGTRTWEAKDGVYATCFQSTVQNPLLKMANEHGLFDPTSDPGQAATVSGTPLFAGLPQPTNPTTYVPSANQFMPYDTSGAIFTGLSSQTTLTVKLRVYVERAPTWNEPSLAVLASPSAGYDVLALELYAQAVNMLPAAVKVSENAAGDWWKAVLRVVKHVAGPVGLALSPFVPGAGIVGGAVSSMLGQLDPSKPIAIQAVEKSKESRPAAVKLVRQTRTVSNKANKKLLQSKNKVGQ